MNASLLIYLFIYLPSYLFLAELTSFTRIVCHREVSWLIPRSKLQEQETSAWELNFIRETQSAECSHYSGRALLRQRTAALGNDQVPPNP